MIKIVAHNYGTDHANAIHNDAGARQHGFAGALVPGVAVYGYLMRPAVNAWGLDWLAHGAASARFLHPVYHHERLTGQAEITNHSALSLQLCNAARTVCATGVATLPSTLNNVAVNEYEQCETRLRPPTIASFQLNEPLGSLEFTLNWQTDSAAFLANMNDPDAFYQRTIHPAFWLALANEVFMRNIALGMWIHTASEIQHCDLTKEGETVSLRGRVSELYEKKGHEYLVADLAAFGESGRPLVHLKHTAIIRLRESTK